MWNNEFINSLEYYQKKIYHHYEKIYVHYMDITTGRVDQQLRVLGANIKTARRRRRMQVKELADRLFISQPTLRRLERGDCKTAIHETILEDILFMKKKQMYRSSESILLIVDMQPKTLKGKESKIIANKILNVIKYQWHKIYAVKWFSNENSTFHLSRGTLLSEEEAGSTDERIENKLTLPTFKKEAPSAFVNLELRNILEKEKKNGKNIFIVGFDYDDCVLSTVLDGHSRNLRIYAIDELCGNAERRGSIDSNLIPSARLLLKSSCCLENIKNIELVR